MFLNSRDLLTSGAILEKVRSVGQATSTKSTNQFHQLTAKWKEDKVALC